MSCCLVWVWLCQLLPSCAERNIGRFACLPPSRFDLQHSKVRKPTFLNCGPLVNYHFPVQNSFFFFNVLQMWEVCLYGYRHYVLFFIYATLLFCSATGVSIELAWLRWTSWHRWLAACKLLEEAGSQQGWLHSQEYGICSGSRKILGFQIRFVTVRIISWRKLISGQKLLNQSTCP